MGKDRRLNKADYDCDESVSDSAYEDSRTRHQRHKEQVRQALEKRLAQSQFRQRFGEDADVSWLDTL